MPWKFNPFTGKLSEVGTSGNAVATQDIISDGNMSIMTYDGIMKYVNRTTIEPSSGDIITEGTITADSFIGDGSQLTGLTGGGTGDKLTNGENEFTLESAGALTFPTLTVPISDNANPSGTGQTLKFSDSSQQAIIYGPESTSEANSAQRIIIQGAPGYTGTGGEGGDVYLWAGPGGDTDGGGGDIKVRAGKGDGTGTGGYLNFQAGDSLTGDGGWINIESGQSDTYGSGGDITVRARGGGEIKLRTSTTESNIDWLFGNDNKLTLPLGSTIDETATTLILTPPTALAGQGLVIRTTVGGGLSSIDTFTSGSPVTVTFTDNGSHLSSGGYVDNSESNTWAYTITGISEADLGSPLTGSFLAENWASGQNVITFNIPAESEGTGFTITLDRVITQPPYYLSGITLNGAGRIELTIGSLPEISHVHLTTADPTTVDLYLGDDDQYVKIEKNEGDVVIGTNTNTYRWRFDTNGALTFPDATVQTTAWTGIPGPYANDAAAAAANVAVGNPYHKTGTSGQVFVRLA
jgi:hypothetical protein